MKARFLQFLREELQFDEKQKVVLAVSGGIDSMVMWHLFRETGLNYIIAHCNFRLRGEASDEDEVFVKTAAVRGEKVVTKSFETASFAKTNKLSIQMAARELRYTWFDELIADHNCSVVATAHHLDDQVETFFVQLFRQGSLKSMSGMPVKTDKVIRPLMFLTKEEIVTYASDHKIAFRQDESNASDKYLRNKVRHHLIPELKAVTPELQNIVLSTMGDLREKALAGEDYFNKTEQKLKKSKDNTYEYTIQSILNLEQPQLFLTMLLQKYGFHTSTTARLWKALTGESGRQFYANKYRIIKDRDVIIIRELKEKDEYIIEVMKEELLVESSFPVDAEMVENVPELFTGLRKNAVLLDYDKLGESVIFRKWKSGDYFYPLGMKGRKKLSDYFIDNKFSLIEKEDQWIMTTDTEICWVVGRRADRRYTADDKTRRILKLTSFGG